MANVRPKSDNRNPLAAIIDPVSPLDAAQSALATSSLFIAHGRHRDARMVVLSAWTALHIAARAGEDPARLTTLSRAACMADHALTEAAHIDAEPQLRTVA